MDVIKLVSELGAVAGTVAVVILFLNFLKGERALRKDVADECHAVTEKATVALAENTEVVRSMKTYLKRLNGSTRAKSR